MKKVLIVDDERAITMMIGRELEQEGFFTISAGTGREALHLARTQNPDLVILDIMLPDMDEINLASELKEDYETKDIPVIFISGLYTKEEAQEKGYSTEGSVFISKPFTKEELLMEVRKLI